MSRWWRGFFLERLHFFILEENGQLFHKIPVALVETRGCPGTLTATSIYRVEVMERRGAAAPLLLHLMTRLPTPRVQWPRGFLAQCDAFSQVGKHLGLYHRKRRLAEPKQIFAQRRHTSAICSGI